MHHVVQDLPGWRNTKVYPGILFFISWCHNPIRRAARLLDWLIRAAAEFEKWPTQETFQTGMSPPVRTNQKGHTFSFLLWAITLHRGQSQFPNVSYGAGILPLSTQQKYVKSQPSNYRPSNRSRTSRCMNL